MNLNIVRFEAFPIFEQLRLEEALLRADSRNWCFINCGTPPAIVMGLSARVEETVEQRGIIPIIRRFSGGGTVVVDEDTIFLTLIINGKDLPCKNNPVDVMAWTGKLLAPAFAPKALCIEEQDYVLDGLKIGGNAQSFSCGRVLHHTSFLWSWRPERMDLLKIPQRAPSYRKHRTHAEFCNKLLSYFPSKQAFIHSLERSVSLVFECKDGSRCEVEEIALRPHRKALSKEEL